MAIRFCSIFANSLPRCAPVCFRSNHHHYLSQTIFEPKKNNFLPTKFSPIKCTHLPTWVCMRTEKVSMVLKRSYPRVLSFFQRRMQLHCSVLLLQIKNILVSSKHVYCVLSYNLKYLSSNILYTVLWYPNLLYNPGRLNFTVHTDKIQNE